METTTYSVEQIAADFEDMITKEPEYIPELYGNREYYVVTFDLEEELEDEFGFITTAFKFLSTLVKIDGTIIRTNINDEELVNNGSYIANFLITLPSETSEEFKTHTGLELVEVFYEDKTDEKEVSGSHEQ